MTRFPEEYTVELNAEREIRERDKVQPMFLVFDLIILLQDGNTKLYMCVV